MKILIVGATGLLGSNLYAELSKKFFVIGTYFSKKVERLLYCDTDIETLNDICIKYEIDTIINCAGLANVEECEKFPERAWQLNAKWVNDLALFAHVNGIKLVHISTDHFQSNEGEKRNESCVFFPVNQYGYSKYAGEKFCILQAPNSLILRINFIGLNRFGFEDKSLLSFFVSKLKSREEIHGFTDVYFNPVSAIYIARAVEELLISRQMGFHHVGASECVSKFDFGLKLAHQLGVDNPSMREGRISWISGLVKRPEMLCLESIKLAQFIELQDVNTAIKEALELSHII